MRMHFFSPALQNYFVLWKLLTDPGVASCLITDWVSGRKLMTRKTTTLNYIPTFLVLTSVSSAVLPDLSLHIFSVKGKRALLSSGFPSTELFIYICLMFVGTSIKKGTKSKIKEISLSILKQSKVESFCVQSMNLKKKNRWTKKESKICKISPTIVSARKNRWTRNDVYELLRQRQTFPWRLIATKVEYAQVLCWSCTTLLLQCKP